MGSIRLTTTLQPRGPAAAVILDDDAVAAVGEGAKRFPVAATINGHTWRTTVTRMGGEFLLGLNRAVRQAAGAEAGDTVEGLSFTHRKEYATWIAEANKEETRERRVSQALELLRAGKPRR